MTPDSFDLENAACGIAVLDEKMVFLAANATLAGMLQTDSASMLGQPLDPFLSAAHRLLFHMQAVTVLHVNGRVDEMQLSLTDTQGQQVPVMLSAINRVRGGLKVTDCVFLRVPERKRLEDELFNIKKAVEQVPGMVFQYLRRADGTSCFPYTSDGVRTVYEVLPVQLLDSAGKVTRRIHPDDRDAVSRSIDDSADHLSIWHHEYRVNLPERGLRWLEGHAVPEARVDGSILWHGHIADVTDRHQQYQATDAQLQLLETSVSRLNDIVLITEAEPLDEPGPRIVFVNDAFVRRTGYSREEAIGQTPRMLQGAKTQRSELDRIGAALRRWEPVRAELINYTKAGQEFWLELDIVPIADAKGWYTHWVAVERDITERKQLEESARLAAKRFEDLVRNATVGIWVLQDHKVVLANHAARRILGDLDLLAAPERSFYDAIHPDDKAAAVQRMARHADGKEMGGSHQLRVLRADGTLRWLEVSGVGTNWDDRDATLWFGTDITGRRNTEEQLREVQKLEAIGQLTGGLAHDFNNLLGIVVGNLDEIGEELPPTGRVRQQHKAALDAALRGAEVTRSLLAVARRQPMEVQSYDLNALVVEMLPLINASAGSAVKVLSQFAPGSMMAWLDSGGLSNVVLNLTINARDAMQDMAGERVLTLRTRREHVAPDADTQALAPGWYAVLEVCDNGHGMSQSVREQAFEPFFTTKERGKGTGLGLAMVYGYATQLGGTAQIDSAAGAGTTVRLLLPMEPQQAQREEAAEAKRLRALRALMVLDTAPQEDIDALVREDAFCAQSILAEHQTLVAPPAPAIAPAAPGTDPSDALRVLVVDDEPALCELACSWLEGMGYAPTGAHSPMDALALLSGQHFTVLFTDVVMPGPMDGVTLAREALRRQPDIRVVLTSGYAQCMVDEPDPPGPLLNKPYRKKELAALFAKVAPLAPTH